MKTRALVAGYVVLGAVWVGFARWAVPPVIAAAYHGRSLPVLNAFFRGRLPHPVEHYFGLWNTLTGAVLIAGALHLAVVLAPRWNARREGHDSPGAGPLFATLAAAFLGLTLFSGPRHDYVADLEIWDAVSRGADPWWIVEGRGIPLNAYGPLFNVLTLPARVNPMAPKLLFAAAYLFYVAWITESFGLRGNRAALAWFFNPFPWVEIAYFGHFDVLVGAACVGAVHARLRGRDVLCGACVAAGVLLKYIPAVILPFLVFDGRRFRPGVFRAGLAGVAVGMGLSLLVWGRATLRPLTFAATRGSSLLSIFRFLRGEFSPLHLVSAAPDLDYLAGSCLAAAGLSVFAWCLARRTGPAASAVAAVSTTLLFYQVGYVQYQMIAFLLVSYWVASTPDLPRDERWPYAALAAYFGALGAFDVWYATVGGLLLPEDPYGWVEDAAGLPAFLLGSLALAGVLRLAGRQADRPAHSPLASSSSR